MSQLLITVCTRAANFQDFESRPIYQSLKKQVENNSNVDFFVISNNQEGLSKQYNKVLKDPKHKDKIVLFVHDDVELNDLFLYEKLINSPYSITGLAGATSFNKLADKLAWHLAAPKHTYVGEVAHSDKSRVWTTVFGPVPSRALTLDGLFLSVKINDVTEKELLFDEEFNFHFYDIAFCLRANQKQITCGVLPVYVVHYGLGDSMLTPEWEHANTKFKQQYCQ